MAFTSPTYYSHIDSGYDAVLIVEACLRRILNPSHRRLVVGKETEYLIKSGNVFVFNANSKIKRWTDGHSWSASRWVRGFFQYRQLNPKLIPKQARFNNTIGGVFLEDGGLYLKEGGLIKRTIRINARGTAYSVISYFTIEDLNSGILKKPSNNPLFANITPRSTLLQHSLGEVDPALTNSDSIESKRITLSLPTDTRKSSYSNCGYRGFRLKSDSGFINLCYYRSIIGSSGGREGR
jgi:hypothetical protein